MGCGIVSALVSVLVVVVSRARKAAVCGGRNARALLGLWNLLCQKSGAGPSESSAC